jgi:adenine-specific DNA-methyltransferase
MLDKEVVKGNTYSAKEIKDLFGVKVFDYPKPSTLIEFLVERGVSLEKNDIVLDFFAGSGTTAQAVMDLNIVNNQEHRYICVQLPEIINPKNGVISKNAFKFCETQGLSPKITELAKERIRRAASKLKEDHKNILTKRSIPLDIGFRVYKLSSSNFMEWDEEKASKDPTQAVLDFAKNKKVDSTPEELLTEIMLRSRITLDTKVEKKTLTNGGWVYVVNDGSLIAYVLDDQLTVEQATEIADMSPAQFVAIDAAFNNNDALKINIANICREKHVGVFKTI